MDKMVQYKIPNTVIFMNFADLGGISGKFAGFGKVVGFLIFGALVFTGVVEKPNIKMPKMGKK